MRQIRTSAYILAGCLLLGLTGCGNPQETVPEQTIELVEPVSAASNTETAAYRNLYDYKTVVGHVYPYIREYALPIDAVFLEYEVCPGDTVSAGDVLLKADNTYLLDDIENTKKWMLSAETAYEEGQDSAAETVAALREQVAGLEAQKELLGDDEKEQEASLTEQIDYCNLLIEQSLLYAGQAKELYELDSAHNEELLSQKKARKDLYVLKSDMDGTVVSAGEISEGSWVVSTIPLVAVADDSRKVVRCEYVNQTEIKKCVDLYAVINGERYRVTYQPYDKGEYNRLASQNSTVYSSFLIDDPENKVQVGDFATLTEIYARSEQVLSVSKNALHKDETGHYVYVMDGGEPVLTRVRTGKSDGVYTEITEGLKKGDVVLLTEGAVYGSNTVTVSRGDFSRTASGDGYMTYPVMQTVTNPIENGTTYFVEYRVQNFATVKEGDVLAAVYVEGDETALYEKQLRLNRLKKRLESAVAAGNEGEAESRKKEIDSLSEEIEKMETDFAATEIRAQTGGMIVWLSNYAKNAVIASGDVVAYIANQERGYITVSDEKGQFVLGTTVTVSYTNKEDRTCTAEGTVVTASAAGISQRLASEYTYIALPDEAVDDIGSVVTVDSRGYPTRAKFGVSAVVRQMENVLLVPKGAVREINGKTYVYIIEDDGTVRAQSFIAGGYDNDNYWVIEGLDEGMRLCLE